MPAAQRVILFVIDGMRPDGLLQANTPVIRRMMECGAYSLAAQTVIPSVTLPTHMTMFHSVPPEVHGVTSNQWEPMPGEPIPGMIELVRSAGRVPAAYYTWEPLRDLSRPGALAESVLIDIYGQDGAASDRLIAEQAARSIVNHRPDFSFVYLGLTDEIAHHYGWMSAEYLQAISEADQAVGRVLSALETAGMLAETACLVQSDHGGHETHHGSDRPEDMTIPWILSGPGIKAGRRLEGPVGMMDTAPTIVHLLGLPVPPLWQGRVIHEALV